MKKNRDKIYLVVFLMISYLTAQAQNINVEVNIDVNHQVGAVKSFDRSKWMVISSSQESGEWSNVFDKFDYIINDLDTYFGRTTGHLTGQSERVNQDPNRAGFADPNHLQTLAQNYKDAYSKKTNRFPYEKGDFIMAAQQLPLYPNGNNPTNQNWYYSTTNTAQEPFGTASGEFLAGYLNNYFGDGGVTGFPRPKYFEVMNEPVWHFIDARHDGGATLDDMFLFHKTVADIIHDKVPGVQVGGFCTAFPDFDRADNFRQWDERWGRFIKDYGTSMDFYTIHLYDRPILKQTSDYRKGGRNEATLDMLEHYNFLQYGDIKPILISEYGAQLWDPDRTNKRWSSLRDWYNIESFNAMLMQFMERPDVILRALPFGIPKAEWGYNQQFDYPYASRLLRKANEPASYTGEWVWTELIKFYELWADVKGLRVDSYSENLDLQIDAYVDDKDVYVILNNIESKTLDFKLNLKGLKDNTIESVEVKRLYLSSSNLTTLDTETLSSFDGDIQIKDDETIVAKYTFKNPVVVDQTSIEKKYYATTYKQPIVANQPILFNINNVTKGAFGEAVLRVGVGRPNSNNLKPVVKVNGTTVTVPDNVRGDLQNDRGKFFGMLEIPVSNALLKEDNVISITFSDSQGFVTSLAMQVFQFTSDIRAFNVSSLPTNNYKVNGVDATCVGENNGEINISTIINQDYKAEITGANYSENFNFSNILNVENLKPDTYKIIVTVPAFPNYKIEFNLNIGEPSPLSVFSKVGDSKKTITLNLEGSNTYYIKLNDKEIQTASKEITLELANGKNDLEVSTGKKCQGIYSETFFIDKSFVLYPNPAKEELFVEVSKKFIGSKAYIYNTIGGIVKEVDIANNQNVISVNNLDKGFYVLVLEKENKEIVTSKFVIE